MCRPPWISAASLLTKALLSLKRGTIWTCSGDRKTLAVLTWIVKKYLLYLVNMAIIACQEKGVTLSDDCGRQLPILS